MKIRIIRRTEPDNLWHPGRVSTFWVLQTHTRLFGFIGPRLWRDERRFDSLAAAKAYVAEWIAPVVVPDVVEWEGDSENPDTIQPQ